MCRKRKTTLNMLQLKKRMNHLRKKRNLHRLESVSTQRTAVCSGFPCLSVINGKRWKQRERERGHQGPTSNPSDVIKAEEEARNELDRALKNHTQLKEKVEQQKTINDNYQKQMEELQTEKTNLKSNISALEANCGRCPPRWILLNSSCYFFSYTEPRSARKNWQDSRANCITRGADLVVIDNKEEQKFVSDTIENMKVSSSNEWENGFWVGLRDTQKEGTWVWINNVTEVEQRYWMDGEPNDAGHHGEDCGVVYYKAQNPWKTRNDVNCQAAVRQWICEMTSK
ncbi:C-type lectin domain family 4 member M CD209 antigen-like protein 1 [Collichthys lucidus]|uniref:C-type lectin domain family 4 member M CD209 antigen-like protein 1 n=1 Tax=Collichthys lucidus TaxID=240159 RepID=A0A4U5VFK3_COLLU|nr:C-type lectin domain family 4 member M CD209 antigen-like protein 1 [Collichthys lucidus]